MNKSRKLGKELKFKPLNTFPFFSKHLIYAMMIMHDLYPLVFYTLMMTFASLWIHRSAILWGSFLAISLILASHAAAIQPFFIMVMLLLLLLFWFLKKPLPLTLRITLIVIAVLTATALNFHLIPGSCSWHVTERMVIHYDQPFMGLFVLTFLLPLIQSRQEWFNLLMKVLPLSLLIIVFLIAIVALNTSFPLHFRWPSHFFVRLLVNLFLMVIPQEAFFRGFIQQEIFKNLGEGIKAHMFSIIAASFLFALFQLSWSSSFSILGLTFLAGIFYGVLYQYFNKIEAPILCHVCFNIALMLLLPKLSPLCNIGETIMCSSF